LGWQRRTWEFTANAPSTTLEFYSLQTGYPFGGPALDNVYVAQVGAEQPTSQVPPPSSKGQVCTFSESTDETESNGTLYAADAGCEVRKRSDISMKFGKTNHQVDLHLIVDSGIAYIWVSSDLGVKRLPKKNRRPTYSGALRGLNAKAGSRLIVCSDYRAT
jgi:hypothetical protein